MLFEKELYSRIDDICLLLQNCKLDEVTADTLLNELEDLLLKLVKLRQK